MSRLIDADELLKSLRRRKMAEVFPDWLEMSTRDRCRLMRLAQEIKKMTDATPTVDAVPVLRCRECVYWRQEIAIGTEIHHWYCLRDWGHSTLPEEYCARGEKR